ncbi:MAG: outer membrane beta-barrel protein [Burkholderiales bacterium]|nr:outer membrane beta-barrel protein [Burkholderiales bacterium]
MRLTPWVGLVAIASAVLGGCNGFITREEPAALPQAEPRPPQDVRTPLPPQQKTPLPAAQAEASSPGQAAAQPPSRSPLAGVYLQLNTGWSWARNAGMSNTTPQPGGSNCLLQAFTTPPAHVCAGSLDELGSSFVIGFGVGYSLPRGFRIDVTYENRSGYDLRGGSGTGVAFDPQVTANTIMVNGYYDIPFKIADRVTPYVGLGIGRTKNKVDDIKYSEPGPPPASGKVPGGSDTSTAWQVTLGANIRVMRNLVIDIGYRYSDLGKLKTNAGSAVAGEPFNADNYTTPLEGKLRANELLLNFRYEL